MIRRYAAPIILALSLSLSGCGSLGVIGTATTGTISSVAPDTVNQAKRLLTAAHEAHRATAELLIVAANTNMCRSSCAATAKAFLDHSEAYLVAADRLAALGDAPGIEGKISASSALMAQVQQIISKGH